VVSLDAARPVTTLGRVVVSGGEGLGRSQSFPFPTRIQALRRGTVAYFDAGEGESVVFVHGLVGDFTHFEHVVKPLAGRFRLAGIDLPGCGLSYKPWARNTIDGYADTLLEWLDARGIRRATLVGHSAGGQVVAQVALRAPERVERLVLIGAAGMRRYPRGTAWLAETLLQPWILSRTLDRLAMPLLDHAFVARNVYTEKFVKDSLDRPIHPTIDEMAKVFHDLAKDLVAPTILENAHRFRMPVLVVWGEKDRLIPRESAAEVAAKLPRVIMKVIPGCGHLPMIECPDEVVRTLEAFFGSVAAPEVTRTIPA
jgi:pimeloyl-ACP methyl ester carboxylesterase